MIYPLLQDYFAGFFKASNYLYCIYSRSLVEGISKKKWLASPSEKTINIAPTTAVINISMN